MNYMDPEEQILDVVFTFPTTRLSYREIERKTDLSIGSVSKYVPKLAEKELINVEILPNAKYVIGNFDNDEFRRLKRLNNIKKLYNTGLIDYINTKISPEVIILFGSFEKGEDFEDSDIDICVINQKKIYLNYSSFEDKLYRVINVLPISNIKKSRKEFIGNLANGFVIKGILEI
jgi:predicted nucleotidyltransferase